MFLYNICFVLVTGDKYIAFFLFFFKSENVIKKHFMNGGRGFKFIDEARVLWIPYKIFLS